MRKMKYKNQIILLIILAFVLLLFFGIYYLFFDINRIKGQELIDSQYSPNGDYELLIYRNNGGATTGYAILCEAIYIPTGQKRKIYWEYNVDSATISWVTDYEVNINGIQLNIRYDVYDFRKDKSEHRIKR